MEASTTQTYTGSASERVSLGTNQKSRRFYQPELDGLRFYAFLGVFVFHTLPVDTPFFRALDLPIPWLWKAIILSGAAGVDLFFALSAFLITSLLLRERLETGEISLRLFYIRRVLRIWPLYYLVLALGIALASASRLGRLWYYTQSLPWYYVAGYLTFLANWIYAAFGAPQSICAPLWTLSIEEQFYLIWPVIAKMLKRRGMLITGLSALLLPTVSQLVLVLRGAKPGYISYASSSRCGSLAVGIILALCLGRLPKLKSSTRFLLATAGLTGLIVSTAWVDDQVGIHRVIARLVISLASGAILYGCVYSRTRFLNCGFVVRLGKVSYGLYMLHFTALLIVLSLLQPRHGWRLLAAKFLGFILSIFLALASYRWVESPFLRLKNRFARIPSRPVE
jgi:peptidoglycan/LPS O-acetylase OafA/YrhL